MSENVFEPSPARVKREPPVEFVLILPRPTYNWLAVKKEEEAKPKWWVKSVNVQNFDAKWRGESSLFQTFFVCPHCQLVLKTQGHLTQHLRTCSKINSPGFECDICLMRFQYKYQMRQHMIKHSSEGKFCCSKCGHGFKAKNKLLKHLKSKMVYKCAVCDVTFSCKLLLDRHRSEFHGNVFKCDKCSYQTRNQYSLINHEGSHDKSIVCETCQKKFSRNHLLKLHQMQHRHGIYATAPEETFACKKCGKTFSSLIYLNAHQKQVHDETEVKCEVCDKIFKNRNSLRMHSQTHVKVECSICHETIVKQFMPEHLRLHPVETPFECDFCNYSTRSKINLKEHIERMHLLRKLVEDSKCREDFSEFELLERLQLRFGSSSTSSEKKFQCDQCSKAFVAPRRLNQHKKIYHVEKLVECEICKRKVRQYHLKSHMKFHSPGNHFECDFCTYKSDKKKSLESHIKARHRNGALICPFGCKDKFADFRRLIEHRKIHVEKKLWKCTKCDYQTINRQLILRHLSMKKHKMLS